MNTSPLSFPVYRKYINGKSYFKITTANSFEEIQVVGNNYLLSVHEARILPDRNFIYDMIHTYQEHWLVINEQEYENIKSKLIYSP